MPTIVQLSSSAGDLARSMSAQAGLTPQSPILFALASGFDVALTLIEQATGARFSTLTSESAVAVVKYFEEEAARSEEVDAQVAIFYRAWAEVLKTTYLRT